MQDARAQKNQISNNLIKSKRRVSDHGEVFTPSWLVESILDLTVESDMIQSRYLEPSCGTGNFLVEILRRKLDVVGLKTSRNTLDRKYLALASLSSMYGIELLADNVLECRNRILDMFSNFLGVNRETEFHQLSTLVVTKNIIHGDALAMLTHDQKPIIFTEWEFVGKRKFQRKEFRLDKLVSGSTSPEKIYEPESIFELVDVPANSDLGKSP